MLLVVAGWGPEGTSRAQASKRKASNVRDAEGEEKARNATLANACNTYLLRALLLLKHLLLLSYDFCLVLQTEGEGERHE